MTYVNIYIMKYIKERVSWLENRQKTWDQKFSELMMSFHKSIVDMVEELKDNFNDKDDPVEIHKVYLENIQKSFENLEEQIRLVTNDNDLEKLWNELTLNFSLWKDSFKEMGEKMDNYNSVFKLGYEIFSVFNKYLTKSKSTKYFDLLKGELDDQRQSVIDFFSELKDDFKLRIVDLDAEEIFDMANLHEKDTDELNLIPGDEVRYYKNDGEENQAIISHNQEDLKDDSYIRLVSKENGDQFEIGKSELIEIIPKHKTLNQEVSDKLKHIKRDPNKLDKLNDYLTDLQKTDESYGSLFDDSDLLTVTDQQTKRWMSNPNFKKKHIKLIGKMLREVYKPVGHWKKYQFWGVMDLKWEGVRWSILNKINTNYSALAIMINELNRALKEGNSSVSAFDFSDKRDGTREFYQEYDRMMEFVDKNKHRILLKLDENGGSRIINKIIAKIQNTSSIGDKAEKLVTKYIPHIYPNATDIKMPEGSGESQDMAGGVDITFKINGQEKTVQVKRCRGVFRESNGYKVVGTSLSKHYNVDYFACVTSKYLYFFEYNKDSIKRLMNGDVVINHSLYIKSYKLRSN